MSKDLTGRNPQNRLKNWTGTVHWARDGKPVCGQLRTHNSYLAPSVATVNCQRCIAIEGGDVTGYVDPPVVQVHADRRAAERAARQAARQGDMQEIPQHKMVLRKSKTARWVRTNYPAGTRIVATPGAGAEPRPGAMHGTVVKHVPGLNAQGGYLVVEWDNGHTGRVSPGSVAREA